MHFIFDSIKFLSDIMVKYYNKNVIILIDEYDVPLENAFHQGFYTDMVNLICSVFDQLNYKLKKSEDISQVKILSFETLRQPVKNARSREGLVFSADSNTERIRFTISV